MIRSLLVLNPLASLVVDQPPPSRPLECSSLVAERLYKLFNRPKSLHNLLIKVHILSERHVLIWWAETVPEELMIQVSASIELDGLRELSELLVITTGDSITRLLLQFVVVGDVSCMVLAIVVFH